MEHPTTQRIVMIITIPGQWPYSIAGVAAVAASWLVTVVQHPTVGPIQLRTAHSVSNDDLRDVWAKQKRKNFRKIMENLYETYVFVSGNMINMVDDLGVSFKLSGELIQ